MSRLIDADALIADVTERYCKDCNKRKGMKNGKLRTIYEIGEVPCRACDVDDMKSELDDAPTVDAVPVKHGHWIYCKGSNGKDYRKCPVCLHTQEITGVLNYCPICGAKMDLLDDDTKWETIENGVKVAKYNCTAEEIEEVKEIMEKRFFADGEKTGDRK